MPAKVRRYEFKQGSSNKFYEVTVRSSGENPSRPWVVRTKWGRIGARGSMQEFEFTSKWTAENFCEKKIAEKKRKGYQDTTGGPQTDPTTLIVPEVKTDEIKLPKIWKTLQDQLLPGEQLIYERHNDNKTKQRRNALAKKYKALVTEEAPDEETASIRKAAWLYLRYTYLIYLTSTCLYKPATIESAVATLTELKKKLNKLPSNQKAAINTGLKKFSKKTESISLKECEEAVESFTRMMIHEITEKKRTGLGGVSIKRFAMLNRKKTSSG